MKKIWTWNWTSGGYNSCFCETREEAIKIATERGAEVPCVLMVDEDTVRVVSEAQMSAIHDSWAGCCD